MRKSTMAMAVTVLIGTVLMMMMSGVYLAHLPTEKDLEELEKQISAQSRIFLDPSSELEVEYVAGTKSEPGSLSIRCQLTARIAAQRPTVERLFHRLADSVLYHPLWRRHIKVVTISQIGVKDPLTVIKTRENTVRAAKRPDSVTARRPAPVRRTAPTRVSGKTPVPTPQHAVGTK